MRCSEKRTIISKLFRERIAPGAFTEALQHDDVRGLFNHSVNFVLSRLSVGTLQLSQDAIGLKYTIAVNANDVIARSIAAQIQRGDVSGSSFSFGLPSDDSEQWTKPDRTGLPLRVMTRIRLIDVGPVTFPAYQAATATNE